MSNIFEALNRGQGEVSDLILPLIGTESLAKEAAPPAPAVPQPTQIPANTAAAPRPDPASPAPAATVSDPGLCDVRTLPIRIASPSPLLPFDSGHWQASEQYRIIRTRIVQHPQQYRALVVSSAGAGDGKSITAINIAGVLGLKSQARVLLVDADLRRSSIHLQLGLPEGPGLAEVLTGACTLEQALVQIAPFPNLYVLTAGTSRANPVELLDNAQWPALCARFRKLFRYIVFDSPPIAAVADYDLIQSVCDGLIMVVRPDHTNRRLCMRALEAVPKDKMIGVLLNCVKKWFLGKYTTPDYYYYSDGGRYETTK